MDNQTQMKERRPISWLRITGVLVVAIFFCYVFIDSRSHSFVGALGGIGAVMMLAVGFFTVLSILLLVKLILSQPQSTLGRFFRWAGIILSIAASAFFLYLVYKIVVPSPAYCTDFKGEVVECKP